MNVKIDDLMTQDVVSVRPHHTIDQVRMILQRNGISALPVVGVDNEPLGIVTQRDLLGKEPGGAPVSQVMSSPVRCVPRYNDVTVAARIMRKHKIHHVVVTHERQLVGIVSSYDLLSLVEGHRFQVRAAPTSKRARG